MSEQNSNQQTNVLAIVGMILGIVSILIGCCSGWYAILIGIPGLICSILSRKQSKTGMAVAGIVCSIIGIIIGILLTVILIGLLAILELYPELFEILESYGYYGY